MSAFQDRTAIVTGGGAGIGRALCLALAARGARVIVADVDTEGAGETVAALAAAGGHGEAARLDVTDAEAVQALVAQVAETHGRLDFMFNNAGIAVGGEIRDIPLDHWERVVDVNLWGVVYGCRAAYVQMLAQGSGHIVNTASLAGLVGCPTNAPYAATKAAVVNLSHSLRAEGEALGVRVTAACPGFVDTEFFTRSPVVNVDRKRFLDSINFKKISVETAAALTLRGVEKNRATVVFPFIARLAWRLGRIHTSLLEAPNRKMVETFRDARGG